MPVLENFWVGLVIGQPSANLTLTHLNADGGSAGDGYPDDVDPLRRDAAKPAANQRVPRCQTGPSPHNLDHEKSPCVWRPGLDGRKLETEKTAGVVFDSIPAEPRSGICTCTGRRRRNRWRPTDSSNIAALAATLLSPALRLAAPVPRSDPIPLTAPVPRSDPIPLTAPVPRSDPRSRPRGLGAAG